MEHLEGQQSIIAAMQARQRRIEVILLAHGVHDDKYTDLLTLAEQLGVPLRRVDRKELDALAHGSSHGGVIAICSPKPRLTVPQLNDLLDSLREPPLMLLIEGVEDARNLGFVLRSAEAMGVSCGLDQEASLGFRRDRDRPAGNPGRTNACPWCRSTKLIRCGRSSRAG